MYLVISTVRANGKVYYPDSIMPDDLTGVNYVPLLNSGVIKSLTPPTVTDDLPVKVEEEKETQPEKKEDVLEPVTPVAVKTTAKKPVVKA